MPWMIMMMGAIGMIGKEGEMMMTMRQEEQDAYDDARTNITPMTRMKGLIAKDGGRG